MLDRFRHSRDYFCPLLIACAAMLLTLPARAGGPTLEQLSASKGVFAASLSPDGRYVATVEFAGRGRSIMLMDTATGVTKVIGQGGMQVIDGRMNIKMPWTVSWVTNDLMAVDYFGAEPESIDLAGEKVADLGVAIVGKAEPGNPASPMLLVYALENRKGFASVNARTGRLRTFDLPASGELLHWALDGKGELRAVTLRDSAFWTSKTSVSNWYRRQGQAQWEKLAEFKVTDNYWTPLEVPEQDGKLVVMSSAGRDTRAVFSYDVGTREIGELMAGHPTQDIVSAWGSAAHGFDALATEGMRPQRIWFDPRWHAVQQSIDEALPGRINVVSGDPARRVLVFSYSDVDPGSWYLVNMEKLSVGLLGRRMQPVEGVDMRPMEIMAYAARDGLSIPAYLTRPAGKSGPQPTVVLIHGGPAVRDEWKWNAEVQLLAARGYVVFQPQFRGSNGFGRKFLEAGFGQWGLAMQDDVSDGVQHLVRQGIADPDRICIYGASYGGYAALWGLVKTPDLYRCGVSYAGVSDIEFMFNDNSDTNDSNIGKEFMRFRVGDLRISQAQFDAVSPLKRAAAIRAPVLLMHGNEDRRVPISHSKKMMKALGDAGREFEWEEFDGQGHGPVFGKDRPKFFERLLAFLDKHIGAGIDPAAGAEK